MCADEFPYYRTRAEAKALRLRARTRWDLLVNLAAAVTVEGTVTDAVCAAGFLMENIANTDIDAVGP